MNDFLDLVKSLNSSFVYLKNGIITESNIDIPLSNINKDLDIVVIHDIDDDTNIEINVNDNINVKILELFKVNKLSKNINVTKTISSKENSKLYITTISYDELEEKDKFDINFYFLTNLYKNAVIETSKIVLLNHRFNTSEVSNLNEEESNLTNYNVYINYTHDVQNVDIVVNHLFKDTVSQMRNYGISKYNSELILNTNGVIKNGAKRSNVNQKNTGLLVDLDSKITAMPLLQIDEYDCLASHGAGIGALDEDALYYLMTRGLSREESEKLIVGGFVNPILEKIGNKDLKEKVENIVSKYL